uniref:Uncharacterized protein n=1 Tax=Brassica campestris TaxID=3711 RepID=A0A3P5Z8R2_BRACM|nr:unnamed protein product [Brassica rapa]
MSQSLRAVSCTIDSLSLVTNLQKLHLWLPLLRKSAPLASLGDDCDKHV